MSGAEPSLGFSDWIHARLGYVFGNDGKGGSGTSVQLMDGSSALLTARHVVIDCILTGSIQVGNVGDQHMAIPKRIWISARTDAAYIISSNPNPRSETLSFADWTSPPLHISAGHLVYPSGVPGSWKIIDSEKRALPRIKALVYESTLANPPQQGSFIICNVNEKDLRLPKSFRGMSGGALFSADKRFLGILDSEVRDGSGGGERKIRVTPIQDLEELHGPNQLPLPIHMGQKVDGKFPLVQIGNPTRKAVIQVHGDMCRSLIQPGFSFGRIRMIRFLTPPEAADYSITMESIFYPTDDSDAGRKAAFDQELRLILSSIGWGIEGPSLPE